MFKKLFKSVVAICCLVLSACATGPVDEYREAKGQDSRVKYIILHYTWESLMDSIKILTEQEVSAHYLITDEEPARVIQLVDENRRAWHAGKSQWGTDTNLNAQSIGIEIVNLGPKQSGKKVPSDINQWQAYTSSQIERLIVLLKDIQQRHQIQGKNILAHSDIAPQRKLDPGPAFPWQWLAQEGLGRWYDEHQVASLTRKYKKEGLPSTLSLQKALKTLGYDIELTGDWTSKSQQVLRAFQMHYRPVKFDGRMDAQTAAILMNLRAMEASEN
ncbi:N-acetylmuramoyl-L-alanine amidase [Pelistega indica]|uniref:N-acetylmuramoyl-L-alanine amidase n=1 Tax=Pelistega indica TaxID=1414851 RepID=V8G8M6_9BURK|nr:MULTISPECIES: N-acetylmuramoyl-L-alanine amidase [Pelistega]ETD72889.1 N-acetylmuramoyl-L-alanine amidase [Pelistega indica]